VDARFHRQWPVFQKLLPVVPAAATDRARACGRVPAEEESKAVVTPVCVQGRGTRCGGERAVVRLQAAAVSM